MKLLVVGGAGYIGSHMVLHAKEAGHDVIVLDNFSTGHTESIADTEYVNIDILDFSKLNNYFKDNHFDGVIHFAAKSIVSESVLNPYLYYLNNVNGTINLVNSLIANEINNLVFSSTAAIFGKPLKNKIDEDHPREPINTYGRTKNIIELFLDDICNSSEFNATLRYFNAAGAHSSGTIGESHKPETHLIPNVLNSLKIIKRLMFWK